MKYQRLEQYSPAPTHRCRIKKCGNRVELMSMSTTNRRAHTIRLDKDHMLVVATGEIIDVVHNQCRTDDLNTIRHSLQRGRDMINTNVTDPDKCLWLTLTYRENMQDPKKLYDDFRKFVQKFRRHYGQCEYIAAAEPQERGAWHMHVILIFAEVINTVCFDAAELYELWDENGWVTVTPCYSSGTGDYLCAYLTNEVISEGKEGKNKAIIKGSRLRLYPSGMQIFRFSRGLKKPEIEDTMYVYAQDQYCNYQKVYDRSIQIEDEDGGFGICINYQVFDLTQLVNKPVSVSYEVNEIIGSRLDPLII